MDSYREECNHFAIMYGSILLESTEPSKWSASSRTCGSLKNFESHYLNMEFFEFATKIEDDT